MINQIMLALTGVVAIYLTQQSNDNLKRYACLFGIGRATLLVLCRL